MVAITDIVVTLNIIDWLLSRYSNVLFHTKHQAEEARMSRNITLQMTANLRIVTPSEILAELDQLATR